jgi:hypothetical protein
MSAAPPKPTSRFCPGCGLPLTEEANFCPHCGRSVGYTAANLAASAPSSGGSFDGTIRSIGVAVGAYASLAMIVLLVIDVGVLIWGMTVVLPIAADPTHGTSLYLILPLPHPIVGLVNADGFWFGLYFDLVVAAIVASVAWTFYRSARPLWKELAIEKPKEGHSPIYSITTLFMAIMTVNLVYVLLVFIFNVQTTTPDFGSRDLWQLLFAFANAAVWEELIMRVLWLGVPLLIIALLTRRAKNYKQYFLGGGLTFGTWEVVFIFVSAGLFAFGHTQYWDAFKIIPTFASGVAFGYLFIRYGLYACIVLHFAVDYYDMLGTSLNSLPIQVVYGLVLIAFGIVGIPYLVVYTRRIILFLSGRDLRPRATPAPMAMKVPATSRPSTVPVESASRPGAFFTCTRCGNHEAVLREGQLECARCGLRQ